MYYLFQYSVRSCFCVKTRKIHYPYTHQTMPTNALHSSRVKHESIVQFGSICLSVKTPVSEVNRCFLHGMWTALDCPVKIIHSVYPALSCCTLDQVNWKGARLLRTSVDEYPSVYLKTRDQGMAFVFCSCFLFLLFVLGCMSFNY